MNRPRPLWPRIVATVVVVPVLYVASFGPACWAKERWRFGSDAIDHGYQPLIWLADKSPRAKAIIFWYARLGASGDNEPTIVNGKLRWFEVFPFRHFKIIDTGQSTVEDSEFVDDDEGE